MSKMEIAQAIFSGFGGMALGVLIGGYRSIGLMAIVRWGLSTLLIAPMAWFVSKEFTEAIEVTVSVTILSSCFGYFILVGLMHMAKLFMNKPFEAISKVGKKK